MAAARIAAGILLARLFGLARELLAARFFGVGPYGDVYGTAMRLPNLLQNLLGEQTLSAAFIPRYAGLLGEGKEREAGRFAGAALGLLLVAAAGLALLGVLLARPLVSVFAAGYLDDAAKVRAGELAVDRFPLAVDLVRIVFPMAGVLVISAWALAVLNSHRRFFLPYVAPVAWNGAIIAALWWWGRRVEGGGVSGEEKAWLLHVAAWAALAGAGLQLLVQVPAVARLLRGFRLGFSRRAPGIPEALSAVGPVLAGRGVVQLSGYLDAFLATLLAAGAVAAQRYALTLYMLPISLFAMSVAAAELPELSRLREEGRGEAHLARLAQGVRQICFLTVPALVGFLAFGWLVVGVVFRGGAFGAEDQVLVALVLAGYSLGLLPTTIARLLQNLFYSLRDTRYPARVAVGRVTASAAVGVALMVWLDRYAVPAGVGGAGGGELRLGALGLALGSAVGGWIELALLLRGARRRLARVPLPVAALGRMLGLALAAAAVAGSVWWLLAGGRLLVVGLAVVAVFAVGYLGGAAALRFPELRGWLGQLR